MGCIPVVNFKVFLNPNFVSSIIVFNAPKKSFLDIGTLHMSVSYYIDKYNFVHCKMINKILCNDISHLNKTIYDIIIVLPNGKIVLPNMATYYFKS